MIQHKNDKYKCSNMGTSEFLIFEMVLIEYPHSAEVQLKCFTDQLSQSSPNTHLLSSLSVVIMICVLKGWTFLD